MNSITKIQQKITHTLHKNHHHLTTTHSTNDQLTEWLHTQQLDPTQTHLLTADQQTQGRGQAGRTWQSPKGNLYLSLYFPIHSLTFTDNLNKNSNPNHSQNPHSIPRPTLTGLLSPMIATNLLQIDLLQNTQPKIGIKWANDIGYYNNHPDHPNPSTHHLIQFHKLAGILIEPINQNNQTIGILVGVGMNINQTPNLNHTNPNQNHVTNPQIAISLNQISTHNTPINAKNLYHPIAHAIIHAILQHNQINHNPTNNPQDNLYLQDFLSNYQKYDLLYQHSLQITPKIPNIDIQQGIGVGINPDGSLKLQQNDKIIPIYSGYLKRLD